MYEIRFRRSAFTAIELIVVAAAVFVVVALLLPAIQETREAARNSVCQKRMATMVQGAVFYEVANNRIPAELSAVGAVSVFDWSDNSANPDSFRFNQHTSLHVQIAPFIGLEDVVEGIDPLFFDFDSNIIDAFPDFANVVDLYFGEASNANLFSDVPEFTCPSDEINEVKSHPMGMMPAVYLPDLDTSDLQAAVVWPNGVGDGRSLGARTNYLGCFGASTGGDNRNGVLGDFRGAVGHREIRRADEIPDGAANTVLFGESIGTIQWRLDTSEFERNFTQYWFMGANTRGRGDVNWAAEPPLNTTVNFTGFWSILNAANPDFPDPQNEPDPRQGILGSSFHARSSGFGSMHKNGVNFAMLDGSVRTVSRDTNWQTLYEMFGAFDSIRPGLRITPLD